MNLEITRKKEHILLGSSMASVISTFVTNPVEVAKLNIQFFSLSCPSYPHQSYQTLSDCSCSQLSWRGSMKSLKVAIPQALFSNILYTECYQNLRQYMIANLQMDTAYCTLFSSFISRFIVTTINTPIQSLRIKISNKVKRENNLPSFHGYKITLARDIIYSALFWSLLEGYRNQTMEGEYRSKIAKNQDFTWKNLTINLLPAFVFSGAVSAITTPLDTIKTRVQSKGIKDYQILASLHEIYNNEGLKGLFSGLKLRVIKNSLHNSIYLFIFEGYMRKVKSGYALKSIMGEQL